MSVVDRKTENDTQNRITVTRDMHSSEIHLFVVNYERARLVYSVRYDKYA